MQCCDREEGMEELTVHLIVIYMLYLKKLNDLVNYYYYYHPHYYNIFIVSHELC